MGCNLGSCSNREYAPNDGFPFQFQRGRRHAPGILLVLCIVFQEALKEQLRTKLNTAVLASLSIVMTELRFQSLALGQFLL
jgi:hypothetical protein